ncbi:MAG: transferrin receptor-like dimerization domain-containing protein [Pseudomonadota bacterium]
MDLTGRILAAIGCAALLGAAPSRAKTDQELERALDASISASDEFAWLQALSSVPNHIGSPHDKANAEMLLALYRNWGWDAHIETFYVLYPTPIATRVEMIAPEPVLLGGQEPGITGDVSTLDLSKALPPYLAYQGDGDVTAPIVYVNYGMPRDYELLSQAGIDVKGKIVLARYGGGWRGLKPKLAEQHGAAGCLIYSDPADDGYRRGDPYPEGGWRPAGGVQRGSVADIVTYPGDPLTPGVGADAKAKRLSRAEAKTILHIPALPISYGDAVKLIGRLGGPSAPASWQGGLPLSYHFGGATTGDGSVIVHLAVKSDWSLKPIHDVIAVMKGKAHPDEWIVRGNHYDGWVFGAADPLSGQVALLSEAKAIGALVKRGWRPQRTIIYASWDGEEAGILGSTEWAEKHARELKAKAVAYLNTDDAGRGILHVEGSHDLQHFVNLLAADVTDPETGVSLLQRQRAVIRVSAANGDHSFDPRTIDAAFNDKDVPILPAGTGSDYSAYLGHLGIPVLDLHFEGEGASSAAFHSAYDTFQHHIKFNDPGMRYSATLAKLVGRAVLRLADAPTPAKRFSDFADTMLVYFDEIDALLAEYRNLDRKAARMRVANDYRLASDPETPLGAPSVQPATPPIDLTPLKTAIDRLRASATAFDARYAATDANLAPATRVRLNRLLRNIDQLLLDERGLPLRPWYKNLVYAPGLLTGYGAKTLPGVREAIEERRFAEAELYIQRTAVALDAYAERLDDARNLLGAERKIQAMNTQPSG